MTFKSTFFGIPKNYKWPLLIGSFYYFVLLIINYFGKGYNFWGLYFGDFSSEKTYVCEHMFADSIIRQPLSTFTNVIYLFFAIHTIGLALSDKRDGVIKSNLLLANYRLSLCFSFCLFMLTFGSTFYHMSVLHISYIFDMTGVFLVSIFLILYNAVKIANLKLGASFTQRSWEFLIFIVVLLSLVSVCLIFFLDSELIIAFLAAVLVFTSLYFEFRVNNASKSRFLYLGIISGAIATLFFYLDWVYCNEYSYFQGHSTWHIISALSMMSFYYYFRSEKYQD